MPMKYWDFHVEWKPEFHPVEKTFILLWRHSNNVTIENIIAPPTIINNVLLSETKV